MSLKEDLLKCASLIDEICTGIEKEASVDSAIDKLKKRGLFSTDEDLIEQKEKFASLNPEEIELETQELLGLKTMPKTASLGKPVGDEYKPDGSSKVDKWAGWTNKIMNL